MLNITDLCRSEKRSTRFATAFTVGLSVTIAIASTVQCAAAQPVIAGSAGSGTNSYYFALDFRDFAAPQFYAFEYRSNSTSLFFADVLQGLASVPTFSTRISDSGSLGLSLNGIAFAGKEKFAVYLGENSGEPNGYWSQWNSPNGTNWFVNNFGISGQPVAAGQWVGASWVNDFNTSTATAPRVAFAVSDAAPEPGSLTLLAIGAVSGAGIVLRRRRKSAGN
jgi:hypothetical protein